jgi:hypothetical protein
VSDIVERLEDELVWWLGDAAQILKSNGTTDHADKVREARDKIVRLRAERDRLRDALKDALVSVLGQRDYKADRECATRIAAALKGDTPARQRPDLGWLHDMSDEEVTLLFHYMPENLRLRLLAALKGDTP